MAPDPWEIPCLAPATDFLPSIVENLLGRPVIFDEPALFMFSIMYLPMEVCEVRLSHSHATAVRRHIHVVSRRHCRDIVMILYRPRSQQTRENGVPPELET